MSFGALTSKISKKFDNLTEKLPGIGADIRANFEKTFNDLKAEATNITNLQNQIGSVSGLNISDLTASLDPAVFKTNLPAKPGPISFTTKAGTLVPGTSAPPWPNELTPFASYNCLITLACLSAKEVNDPTNTFRKNGFSTVICKSGGTASENKLRTRIEEALGADVEFFIDNLEFGQIMAPDSYSRTSNATNGSFTVSEPYSMGLFWQALKRAAAEAGYSDYTLAPFCLKLEFKGWNVDGEQQSVPYSTRIIPIKFVDSNFSVNGGGSEYNVSFYAWNESALTDTVQQVKTDIALKGRTVREMLQTGAESLTELMNKRLLEMQQKNQVTTPDQYVIIFPKETSTEAGGYDDFGVTSVTESRASIDPTSDFDTSGPRYSGVGLETLYQSIVGSDNDQEVPASFAEYYAGLANNAANAKQIDFMFKKYAASNYSQNLIAVSKIIEDPVEAGIQPMNPPAYRRGQSVDDFVAQQQQAEQQVRSDFVKKYDIFDRADKNLQTSDDVRVFKFKAGTKIQEIIEEVVITSQYGRSLATQLNDIKDPQGMITWYRVETDVYIIPDDAQLQRSGRYPSLYVYRVVPYKVHHSVFANPSDPSVGISSLKRDVAKQYDYIYTGKNDDVLDFEIQYNHSFIYPVSADRGSNTANQAQGASNQPVAGAPDTAYKQSEGNTETRGESEGGQGEVVITITGGQSAGIDNSAIGIARQFNDRLMHSNVDMVMVEMTIKGDPFYISDSGLGNYHAKDTSYSNMNADGHLNHTNGQVHINVMFRTPVDIGAPDGTYIFPEDLIVIDQFSGIYYVPEITSKISGNQFTQTLKMVRVRNQQEGSTTSNVGALVPVTDPTESLNERAVEFQKQVSNSAATLGQEANYEDYLREVQQLLPGFQSLNAVVQKQKSNLSGPALEAFSRIGDSLTGAQSALTAGNLVKVGNDFKQIIGAAGTFIDATGSIDTQLKGTLKGLGLDGDSVLGALGSDVGNAVRDLSRVPVKIPNAVEQAAQDAASKLKNLNSNLRGPF